MKLGFFIKEYMHETKRKQTQKKANLKDLLGGADITTLRAAKDILGDLIAIPSITSDTEMNHQAIEYIDTFLRAQGMLVQRLEWNGTESLIATTRHTKTPTVFFMGHVDVVPAADDLFMLVERDDRYYGRGVLDMKGGIAAYLGMVQQLRDELPAYDFGIMIVTDEETGGFNGAAKLVEAGYIPKALVIMDGAGNWNIERSAKGIWHLTIEAVGKSAHGSRPWEGENAVDKLIATIQDIKAYFPLQGPENSTINVGIFKGGHATNQIPAHATASLDIRYASSKEQQSITQSILEVIERHGIRIIEHVKGDVMTNDPNDPYLATYAACVEQVIGRPAQWVNSRAANDGRWFANYNVQCVISYPRGGGHHGAEEWIGKETLDQMQEIFIDYLNQVAKSVTT